MNTELSALLAKVSVIARKNEEFRRKTGSAFNVFDVCGVAHYETKHSAILATLLDPAGAHGLGVAFLRSFLADVAGMKDCDVTKTAVVHTEDHIDSNDGESSNLDGRLDIRIDDPEAKICVVIENKIYAAEQPKQVERYRRWLERERPGFEKTLLFLTLDGHAPETDSIAAGPCVRLQCASWRDAVVPWCQNCARLAFDRPFVRETLLQYANLINRISGGSIMDNDQKNEIVDAATASAAALRSTVELFRQKGAIYNHVAGKIAADLKARLAVAGDWNFVGAESDPYGKKELFIRLKHVTSGVFVRIAPERREMQDFFIGIDKADAGRFADEFRTRTAGMPGWKQTEGWPGLKYLPDDLLNWQGDFLSDYLDGDKRHVIDTLFGELEELLTLLQFKV